MPDETLQIRFIEVTDDDLKQLIGDRQVMANVELVNGVPQFTKDNALVFGNSSTFDPRLLVPRANPSLSDRLREVMDELLDMVERHERDIARLENE